MFSCCFHSIEGVSVQLGGQKFEKSLVARVDSQPDASSKVVYDLGADYKDVDVFSCTVGLNDVAQLRPIGKEESTQAESTAATDEDSKEEHPEAESKDAEPAEDSSQTKASLQFLVLCDGEVRWESQDFPLTATGTTSALPQECVLNIKGVARLELVVQAQGDCSAALPVWADARLQHAPWYAMALCAVAAAC